MRFNLFNFFKNNWYTENNFTLQFLQYLECEVLHFGRAGDESDYLKVFVDRKNHEIPLIRPGWWGDYPKRYQHVQRGLKKQTSLTISYSMC